MMSVERKSKGSREKVTTSGSSDTTRRPRTTGGKLLRERFEAFGRIDILVNTAQEFFLKPFLEMSLEELRGVSRTNIQSTWLGLKYVIPVMRQSGGGYIVNVTSVLGSVALADAAAYCAAASGVRMMTKSAALECGAGEYNILVNSVQAGRGGLARSK